MEQQKELINTIVKKEIDFRARQPLSVGKAVSGTLYFIYYLTLGYFFSYEKHKQLRGLLQFI
jgi:hypothetical protein